MDETAKLIAVIVLASFATERVLAAVTYLLDCVQVKRLRHPIQLLVAGLLAFAVVSLIDIRVLRTLNARAHAAADFWLTWLILMAGADRAREVLRDAKGARTRERRDTPAVRIHVDGDVRQVRAE